MSPRSRLWWKKTERIARIPPDHVTRTPVVTTATLITQAGDELTTQAGVALEVEA